MTTTIKTEHAGAKNGGGYWGKRAEAKKVTKRKRRKADKQEAQVESDQRAARAGRDPR